MRELIRHRAALVARRAAIVQEMQLEAALVGVVGSHHRLIFSRLLADIELFDEQMLAVSEELERRLASERELIERLDEFPGINRASPKCCWPRLAAI